MISSLDRDLIESAKILALEYALLSKPFTYNRIGKPLGMCIENIAKGKFAEYLFKGVCSQGGLSIDVDRCSTPFWQRDRRDFVLADREWDVKSIYLHALPPKDKFQDCPALMPNKYRGDQWDTRNVRYVPDVTGHPSCVFVFLGPMKFRVELVDRQERFLRKLCIEHREKFAESEPYSRDWFLDAFPHYESVRLELDGTPTIAITGAASVGEWHRFSEFSAGPVFVGGVKVYQTAISNMACRSGDLPAFSSVSGWKI